MMLFFIFLRKTEVHVLRRRVRFLLTIALTNKPITSYTLHGMSHRITHMHSRRLLKTHYISLAIIYGFSGLHCYRLQECTYVHQATCTLQMFNNGIVDNSDEKAKQYNTSAITRTTATVTKSPTQQLWLLINKYKNHDNKWSK